MNVTDEMIGEYQKRMQDIEDNMTPEERMNHEEENYINHLLEEHPELLKLFYNHSKQIEQLEQENETLRSANEDLIKENRTLKNFKNIDVEHPSNKFF